MYFSTDEDAGCTRPTDAAAAGRDAEDQSVDMRIVMMVIGTTGVLGNGLVVFVIFRFTGMRKKVTNLFIINQSAVDFAASVLLIADSVTKFMSGYNVGLKGLAGELYCRIWISSVLQWSTLVSSTYNLVAITIERYMMVVFPMEHKVTFTRKKALWVVLGVWLFGPCYEFLSGVPTSVVKEGVCYGFAYFPNASWQKAYGLITIAIAFFLPMAIHIMLYCHMVVVLRRRAAALKNGHQHPTHSGSDPVQKMPKAQKNLLKTMAVVTVCFFFCWSWNQLAFFFYNLGVNYDLSSDFHLFTITAVNLNSCINPFVYIVKYEEFKAAAGKLLRGSFTNSQVQPGESNNSSATNRSQVK